MVPVARGADLHDVTGELPLARPASGERPQFLGGGDAAAEGGEPGAEDVRHEHELVVGADGAVLARRLPDLAGGPDQFGMGVAHLVLGEPSLGELGDEVTAREPVVDLTRRAAGGAVEGSRGAAHRQEASDVPVHRRRPEPGETLAVNDDRPRTDVSAHAAFPGRAELPLHTVSWGPGVPGDDELRLLGNPAGKRVLQLGVGLGHNAVALALAGAHVIAVEPDLAKLDAARQLAEVNEVKVELHHGDPADLAFVRADTVDTAVSVYTLGRVDDMDRVLRQVNRVLRTSGSLVASFPHPVSLAVERDPVGGPRVVRRYGDDDVLTVGELTVHPHSIATVFSAFHRANFRIDALLEPMGDTALLPGTLLVRGKKDSA